MTDINTGEEITSRFHPGKNLTVYTWDPNKPKVMTAGALSLSEVAKAQGWQHVKDGGISAISGGADKGQLYNEPGKAVTKSALGQVKSTWDTLRNVSADGVVIETVDPKGPSTNSTTGVTVISVPAGVDETALGAALAKLGIDYRPMTQDDAKNAVRGTAAHAAQPGHQRRGHGQGLVGREAVRPGREDDGDFRPRLAGRAGRGGRVHRQDQLLLVRPSTERPGREGQVQRGLPGGHARRTPRRSCQPSSTGRRAPS
jgi:hypothetical protein